MGSHGALPPLLGMIAVLALLGGLLGGLRLAQSCGLHPESARKLFHVGSGLIVLGFPWLFGELWPVLVLAGVTLPALVALKHLRALRAGLGTVLFTVNRRSLGEVCFPLAALALFTLSARSAALYCVPLLILTFADSAAALVGQAPCRRRFRRLVPQKSLEGSLAFFVVAALSGIFPLLLIPACPPGVAVLVALMLSLLLTSVEALSPYGLDNFTVPLAGYLALRAGLSQSLAGDAAMLLGVLLLSTIVFMVLALPDLRGREYRPWSSRESELGRQLAVRNRSAVHARRDNVGSLRQWQAQVVNSRRMSWPPRVS
jgi:phytol kinase